MSDDKRVSLEAARARLAARRSEGKRLVLAFAAFNFPGSEVIDRLRASAGDDEVLALVITDGESGCPAPDLPLLPLALRAEMAAALPFVELVIPADPGMREDEVVAQLQPSRWVSALDSPLWSPPVTLASERGDSSVVQVGANAETPVGSGTVPLSANAKAYIEEFRRRYSAERVLAELEGLSGLRVLVIGDTIIDQYHFCRPYGMPMKAPIIAAQFEDAEEYAGGALAVANHVANFCDQVQLVTCLGSQDPKDLFIRRNLLPNVQLQAFYRPDAPTIVKRRYLRRFLVYRLFEISFFNDSPISSELERRVGEHLGAALPDHDLVLVADYGHGFITPGIIDVLQRRSRFLAVNTQTNSVNMGYNVVTKYPRADYVSLDEDEVRFARRSRFGDVEEIVTRLARDLGCSLFSLTRGHHDTLAFAGATGELVRVPVLSRGVVDTVGAGDAYLSATAPCAAKGLPAELVTFIGNCAGAVAVRIMGNKRPITREALFDYVRELLG